MQALTPTLFPCYAAADREIAAAIAAYLELGAGVRVLLEEGQMLPGEDLVRKAREARMADIVLVLFSRNSLPAPWPRARWEDALQKEPAAENVRIAFVKCDYCVPPRVLTPQFELAGLPLAELRRLKRWVRGTPTAVAEIHSPELESLAVALADQPGTLILDKPAPALEFSRVFRDDFDQVLRLECGGRTLTALAGDLATQLGLRLPGDRDENLARLREFCGGRRFLLWLEGAPAAEVQPLVSGGRSSILITTQPLVEAPAADESLRDIQYILTHPGLADDWPDLCRLARLGLRLAGEQSRLAESFELLQRWHALAEARADRHILDESARAMVWILEGWDRIEEASHLEYHRATEFDEQLALPIPATAQPAPPQPPDAPNPLPRTSNPRPHREQYHLPF